MTPFLLCDYAGIAWSVNEWVAVKENNCPSSDSSTMTIKMVTKVPDSEMVKELPSLIVNP